MSQRRFRVLAAGVFLAASLAGCSEIRLEPVNLNAVETPRPWSDNYRGGRVSPPAGR